MSRTRSAAASLRSGTRRPATTAPASEIDPASGKQLQAIWLDANRAQTPPGSGDLFGLAVTPTGDGIYFAKDETNTLVLAQ